MFGFCISGGIGDAILCVSIVRKLKIHFRDDCHVIYCDERASQVLDGISDFTHEYSAPDPTLFNIHARRSETLEDMFKNKGCSFFVCNVFKLDQDNLCSFMFSLEPSSLDIVREYRSKYYCELSKQIGFEIKKLEPCPDFRILKFMMDEKNCFADFLRMGINIENSDIRLEIPKNILIDQKINSLGDFCVFHDSRLDDSENFNTTKSWYLDRWNDVSDFVKREVGINIVHMKSVGQKDFVYSIPHRDIIGDGAKFYDYLNLISKSKFYVGTCSWPSNCAFFLDNVNFIILRGGSSKRWDHVLKNTSVIRRGRCQGCQYISLDGCPFGSSYKNCMDLIKPLDVIEEIKKLC